MVGVCTDDATANATVKRMPVQHAWRWRLRRSAALLVILMAANEKMSGWEMFVCPQSGTRLPVHLHMSWLG